MVVLRPAGLPRGVNQHVLPEAPVPCFVIHPPTHELAEMLVVDSTALSDENYSGIFDEGGDYIPQYCDNPEEIPQGMIANQEVSPGPTPGSPGEFEKPSSDSSPESDSNNDGS